MGETSIEWTNTTWNPVRGCSVHSPGCTRCYAMRQAHRFSGPGQPYEGLTKLTGAGPQWTGEVRLVPEMLDKPIRWRKPRRIFVNSMSDLFHESLSNEEIAAVFGVMAACPQHTFQVLTKRARRMREWFEDAYGDVCGAVDDAIGRGAQPPPGWKLFRQSHHHASTGVYLGSEEWWEGDLPWPLPNVWLGVSCEDQRRWDERVPHLLHTPAAVRWVSAEPLLGPVDAWAMLAGEVRDRCLGILGTEGMPGLDWLVVGGESGPGARPCSVDWIRDLVQQCQRAEVPVFVKQLGRYLHVPERAQARRLLGGELLRKLRDRKGGDMAEWPDDLKIREMPR